ncbi:MAG: tryptophanase [Candidatus Sericytochromatia bacterium]|nr:tryptophanase [Candidatus Tanganyikabacteria bacterium]
MVAPIPVVPRPQRAAALARAWFNPSLVPADLISFDLLSDSGAGALSDRQAASLATGDEAYAGSRDFADLAAAVQDLFGFPRIVPTHQGRGAENLLCRALLRAGAVVASNAPFETTLAHIGNVEARAVDVAAGGASGDLDLAALATAHSGQGVSLVIASLTCNGRGGRAVSIGNLLAVRDWCRGAGVPLAVDASRIFENAAMVAESEGAWAGRPAREIVRAAADAANVLYMSGKKDGLNKIGGFIAVRDPALAGRLVDLCLVFEGMPTYGGMAGRDMAALAQGLREAADDRHLAHRRAEAGALASSLREAGVPFLDPPGGHCLLLDAARFFPGVAHPGCTLAAALYEAGGVRGAALPGQAGLFHEHGGAQVDLVRLAIPRRVYTAEQLAGVAAVVAHVWQHRDRVRPLAIAESPPGRNKFATRFTCAGDAVCEAMPPGPEPTGAPFVRRVVEVLPDPDLAARRQALDRAGWNMFALDASGVGVDLFTDSGTAAMSAAQWARQWLADDTLIGSCSLARFQEAARATYGMPYALATHQGRGAEAVLFDVLVAPGRAVATNMQFFSTAQHIRRVGADLVDVIGDAAYDLERDAPSKGDVDLGKLRRALGEHDVALVAISTTVNDAGGQPVSRRNLEQVAEICRDARVPLWLDMTRLAENAWFVREAEGGRAPLAGVVRELADLAAGGWVSAKKDCLVNIGGILVFRDDGLLPRLLNALILYEGMPGSGGLAGRDLEFMAVGMREMVDEAYMAHRIGQVRRLWARLRDAGVPVLRPPGGHAVMVDAAAFLPHLAQDESPGHALAAALYLECGARAMPVATGLHAGGQRRAGDRREMLRLTIPRRVYSDAQLAAVADALIGLCGRAGTIPGLRPAEADGQFPFITGRFAPASLVPAP